MATPHPTGWWVTQQPRNLLIEIGNCSGRVRFLIQDRDRKFTATFDVVFAAEAIQVLRTPVRAPRANAYASDGSGPFGGRCWTGCWSLDAALAIDVGRVRRPLQQPSPAPRLGTSAASWA